MRQRACRRTRTSIPSMLFVERVYIEQSVHGRIESLFQLYVGRQTYAYVYVSASLAFSPISIGADLTDGQTIEWTEWTS